MSGVARVSGGQGAGRPASGQAMRDQPVLGQSDREALELSAVLARVADHARTAAAREALFDLDPHLDRSALAADQNGVALLLYLLERGKPIPGIAVGDWDEVAGVVAVDGAVLDPEALAVTRDLLAAGSEWQRCAAAVIAEGDRGDAPVAGDAFRRSTLMLDALPRGLAADLTRLLEPEGTIREEAVPELVRLRADIGRSNQAVMRAAESMIRAGADMYRTDQPTVRDGRVVLPLVADFKGRVDGILHDSSASGGTLYVEPAHLVELNNESARLHHALHRERHRIMRELSGRIRESYHDISAVAEAVVQMDGWAARARYGFETGGVMVSTGESLQVRRARHPLIGRECVPLDLEITPETRLLVISGPNTGGKTVLLKTIGLLTAMHQCAIPVPAAPDTVLPLVTRWGVDIGDEQSIAAALSTFSAHLTRLARISGEAQRGSLALLDELGSGTDPEEGAALSMALVDELLERGATVIVTTHQNAIKNYAYTRDSAQNASMAFDEATHRPTYRVVPGRPGASRAIETASELGFDRKVIERARTYLGERSGSAAVLLERLVAHEEELQERAIGLSARESELDRLREALSAREREVTDRERRAAREALAEVRQAITQARSEVERGVRELRERGDGASADGLLDDSGESAARGGVGRLESLESDLESRLRLAEIERASGAGDLTSPLTAGDRVRHRDTGRVGEVVSVRGTKVTAQLGAIRMTLARDQLLRLTVDGALADEDPADGTRVDEAGSTARAGAGAGRGTRTGAGAKAGRAGRRPQISVERASGDGRARLELDLRGMRVHEAIETLERQVDAAILDQLPRFSVIHGTGTGALQAGVHRYLKERSEVGSVTFAVPEEGGFGKSVVELRGADG